MYSKEEDGETPIIPEPETKPSLLNRITRKLKFWNSCISNGVKILKDNRTNIRNIGIFAGSIFVFRTIYIKASPLRQRITK